MAQQSTNNKGKGKAPGGVRGKKAKVGAAAEWHGLTEPLLSHPRKARPVEISCARLAAEVKAVRSALEAQKVVAAADKARENADAAAEADGTAKECGCCFGDYAPSSMLKVRECCVCRLYLQSCREAGGRCSRCHRSRRWPSSAHTSSLRFDACFDESASEAGDALLSTQDAHWANASGS
jgi:hypothetical protein